MAVKTVRTAVPALQKVNPIQRGTSRGVIEKGERSLFDHRNKIRPDATRDTANGNSLGSKVGGSTDLKGASI